MIDSRDMMEGKTYYDPITNPDGVIDISGASNENMRDFLEEYTQKMIRRGFSVSDSGSSLSQVKLVIAE